MKKVNFHLLLQIFYFSFSCSVALYNCYSIQILNFIVDVVFMFICMYGCNIIVIVVGFVNST